MLLAGAVLTIFASGASAADAPALGFTPEGLAAQRALEARYDALVDAKNLGGA